MFGLCNLSGKNRPCIYMFAMDTNGFQIARVLSKEVLDHTKYEFYLPQMELSTARLISVKWIILVISTFSRKWRIRFRLPVPSFSALTLGFSWWYIYGCELYRKNALPGLGISHGQVRYLHSGRQIWPGWSPCFWSRSSRVLFLVIRAEGLHPTKMSRKDI